MHSIINKRELFIYNDQDFIEVLIREVLVEHEHINSILVTDLK